MQQREAHAGSHPRAAMWDSLRWPESLVANLCIAFLIGFLYIISMVGPQPLNPRNVAWLTREDPATYYIGWEMLRQDRHIHWPTTYTERIGYPPGTSVALFDLNPLAATGAKLLSLLVTTPFQYFGIALAITCSLQFFFGTLLCRRLIGRNFWAVLIPSLFFLISPALVQRLVPRLKAHYAIANHWVILAAFLAAVVLQGKVRPALPRLLFWCCLLAGVAAGINPYLNMMALVILTASVGWAVFERRIGWRYAAILLAGVCVVSLFTSLAVGFLGGGGYWGQGYRSYSMNLFSPINPAPYGSTFLPNLPMPPEQHEGYNYLGAGVLLLVLLVLPGFVRTLFHERRGRSAALACILFCAAIALFAMSTKMYAGNTVLIDLDPHGRLTSYLGIFRASGRFFWMVNYLIVLSTLVAVFRRWDAKTAALLSGAALMIQYWDTIGMRRREEYPQGSTVAIAGLRSPVWHTLGRNHGNLIVIPPWQCDWRESPGGRDGYATFGLLAVEQRMRTNSYYAARYSTRDLSAYCDVGPEDLIRKGVPRDTAFVVKPRVAAMIAAGPAGASACHVVDGFGLCSSATDFGLPPAPDLNVAVLPNDGGLPAWSDPEVNNFLAYGWNEPEPWGVWSTRAAALQFRLTPEQIGSSAAIRMDLRLPIGPREVCYEVRSGNTAVSGKFPGSSRFRLEFFTVRLPIQPAAGGVVTIDLLTSEPVRPQDIRLSADTRAFGLGLSGLSLVKR